jgi:hypothetical protein
MAGNYIESLFAAHRLIAKQNGAGTVLSFHVEGRAGHRAMLRAMRPILLCVGLIALWTGPAAAGPLSACDFITQAEVEKMLGEKVGPPMVTDGGICAGMCATLDGSRCDFSTTGEGKKKFYFYVLLPPYAFSGRAERGAMETGAGKKVAVQDVAGFGEGAFWYYHYDMEQSLFFVYPNRRAPFTAQEINSNRTPRSPMRQRPRRLG